MFPWHLVKKRETYNCIPWFSSLNDKTCSWHFQAEKADMFSTAPNDFHWSWASNVSWNLLHWLSSLKKATFTRAIIFQGRTLAQWRKNAEEKICTSQSLTEAWPLKTASECVLWDRKNSKYCWRNPVLQDLSWSAVF